MKIFDDIRSYWDNNGFNIILGLCIAFILLFGLYRLFSGKKGSWSKAYYYREEDRRKYDNTNNYGNLNNLNKSNNDSKGEIECRRVLNYIFKRPFNKDRPDFLRNPVTGGNYNLELDCFDRELKLAVEYNGKQHYEYIPYFHKNKEAFMNQKYRDDMKRRICKEHNINLIEVPYNVSIHNIKSYIEKELIKLGYI